jgi:PAS domain S-box-containing protein
MRVSRWAIFTLVLLIVVFAGISLAFVNLRQSLATSIAREQRLRDARRLGLLALSAPTRPGRDRTLAQLEGALVPLAVPGSLAALHDARLGDISGAAFRDAMGRIDRQLSDEVRASAQRSEGTLGHFEVLGAGTLVIVTFGIVFAYVRDRRLSDRLRDLERVRDFRRVSAAFDQMVYTARPGGERDFYSPRWTDYSGIAEADLIRGGLRMLLHPDDRDPTREAYADAMRRGIDFRLDVRLRDRDGRYRWHRVRALPLRDAEGAISAWFGSAADIDDDRRKMETLQAAYESEKRIAETLQRAFLPHSFPRVPGLHLDAFYAPAEREALVGGDWYDAMLLPDGRLLVSIGDVAGHGLEAAVLMNHVRQAIAFAALQEGDSSRVLARANAALLAQDSGLVTALCGIIDPRRRSGSFASAGHPPAILVRRGAVETLPLGGLPLGIEETSFDAYSVDDLDDSLLVLYSDGAIEQARDPIGGSDYLRAVAGSLAAGGGSRPARAIYDRIFAETTPRDDVAIMTVAFNGRNGEELA